MNLSLNLRQSRSKVLLVFCLAITAGVGLASWWPTAFNNEWLFVFVWLALLPAFWFWPKRSTIIWLILAGCLLGYWRYQVAMVKATHGLALYWQQDLEVVGRIKTEPELSDRSWRLVIEADNLANGKPVQGGFNTFVPLSEKFAYGDKVRVSCFLEPFSIEKNFDASRYYRRFGVLGTCRLGKIKILASGQGSWFYSLILKWRQGLKTVISNNLPYPEADLGAAMSLGLTNKLNPELKDAFGRSGLTHLMAISGLNVSLLVGLLFGGGLALGLTRLNGLWLALVGVVFFVILVGAPASAVRAGVMGVLFLLAASLGRLNKLSNALAVAAAGSLLVNPFLLRDDVGWQLSFMALLGIIYIYPLLRLGLKSSNNFLDLLWSGLALTLSAQISTWPIVASSFEQVSLVAPLANLLAVWTTPLILITMFAGLLLSTLVSWWLWWLPALIILKYLISVATLSSKLPGATIIVTNLNSWFLPSYYLGLIIVVYLGLRLDKNRKNVLN